MYVVKVTEYSGREYGSHCLELILWVSVRGGESQSVAVCTMFLAPLHFGTLMAITN